MEKSRVEESATLMVVRGDSEYDQDKLAAPEVVFGIVAGGPDSCAVLPVCRFCEREAATEAENVDREEKE